MSFVLFFLNCLVIVDSECIEINLPPSKNTTEDIQDDLSGMSGNSAREESDNGSYNALPGDNCMEEGHNPSQ